MYKTAVKKLKTASVIKKIFHVYCKGIKWYFLFLGINVLKRKCLFWPDRLSTFSFYKRGAYQIFHLRE